MKNLIKKASQLAGALLVSGAAGGCARGSYEAPDVPTQGRVDAFTDSIFNVFVGDICQDDRNKLVCEGRGELEVNAFRMELKAAEHRMNKLMHLCASDFERAAGVFKMVWENDIVETQAACKAEAAELGLLDAAEIYRKHGFNIDRLTQEQISRERQDIAWHDNRVIRLDNHGQSMQDREANRVLRQTTAEGRLEILKEQAERRTRYYEQMDRVREQGGAYYNQYPNPYGRPYNPGQQSQPVIINNNAGAATTTSPGMPQPGQYNAAPRQQQVAPAPVQQKPPVKTGESKPKAPEAPKQADPCKRCLPSLN